MATDDNTPPSGEGNIPAEAQRLLAECCIASETVAQGLERLANMRGGLPQAVQDELVLLRGLSTQLVEAFENLRDWLHSRFGANLAGLGGGGAD